MASPSKEEHLLKLILENSPLKHWHFKELLIKTRISRGALNKWLRKYVDKGLLNYINKKGSFPYYICEKDNPVYKIKKKQYMLNKLYESGLLKEILIDDNIKVAIVFGSVIKGDWYKKSDIDLFILGEPKFNPVKYEKILERDIELHQFKNKKEIKNVRTGLLKNVINGYLVKGNINEIAEVNV